MMDKTNSPSLLYPAFQKFYSAMNALDNFSKDNDFFKNIASLDTFFSEFRNVTFVLQKSLKHTEYFSTYETLRDHFFAGQKWFIDKRNEITKEQPFQLVKKIKITVYFLNNGISVWEDSFTVEDDTPLASLLDKVKDFFKKLNLDEIPFSAAFSFYEKNSKEDLWDKLMTGIQAMQNFLEAMQKDIPDNSPLCGELIKKIQGIKILRMPKDMFLVNDYVYYPGKDEFETVDRMTMMIFPGEDHKKTLSHIPMDIWKSGIYSEFGKNNFQRFVMMHIGIFLEQQKSQQVTYPAIMVVYKDKTYDIDAFQATNRTTICRKLNETAETILNDDVEEVYFMQFFVRYAFRDGMQRQTSAERQKNAEEEWLVFMMANEELKSVEYAFYVPGLQCPGYIRNVISPQTSHKLNWGISSMSPIINAFKKKREQLLVKEGV